MFNRFLPIEIEDRYDSHFWEEYVFPGLYRDRTMSQSTDPATKNKIAEYRRRRRELRPPNIDYSHQDSLFGNSFSSKAYFVVHPEWISENVDPPVSKPLNRPPWPWEQPRYRQNLQRFHAYKNAQNGNSNGEETEESKNDIENGNFGINNGLKTHEEEIPYTVPSSYKITHPPEQRLGY
ncbi:uncharacterized protein LOC127700076 isoform X1 [Mytilus californianus]|uniref:uncharacterized protein LOC127700076 isoform X1 n=1 Tax=Mytilus californianus TaxID=6549 RepID=UPI002246DA00|nr:uncharacterized protein LOC127700076 isoform X1 [Mytilus californianus]